MLKPEEILSIHFGYNNFESYEILGDMVAKQQKYHMINERYKHAEEDQKACSCTGTEDVKKKLQAEMDKISTDLDLAKSKYYILQGERNVEAAYMVFRSAEGKERALYQFGQFNRNRRNCLFCCRKCSCKECKNQKYEQLLFKDIYPDVKGADDPSVILW